MRLVSLQTGTFQRYPDVPLSSQYAPPTQPREDAKSQSMKEGIFQLDRTMKLAVETEMSIDHHKAQSAKRYARDNCNGTSLIEALVAIVVLSLGLLGLAGLQLNALKLSHGAHLRAQAAQLAYDVLDRMRADRDDARAGKYNLSLESDAPTGVSLADTQVAQWLNTVAEVLPSGDASINLPLNSQTVSVLIIWDETRSGGSQDATYRLDTQL